MKRYHVAYQANNYGRRIIIDAADGKAIPGHFISGREARRMCRVLNKINGWKAAA